MSMRTWFITGASSGLGRGIASEELPRVLVLGRGMVDAELSVLQARMDEVGRWREISDSSDFEE